MVPVSVRIIRTSHVDGVDQVLLDKGADPNKPFQGQVHNTTLCCDRSEQLAVLSRRDRVGRGRAEADARARREGGLEPAEAKKEGGWAGAARTPTSARPR
jgi:hypothetical protein